MEHYGWLSLAPTLAVLGIALWTKKTFEALLAGSLAGYIFLHGFSFFSPFANALLTVFAEPTIGWIVLICGLFGSLINLLVKAGGAVAFGNFIMRFARSRASALLATWALGLAIFIDDYLNALTVGTSMKKVTDKFRIPREMLAYVVDSTAAPICVLIPLSTWAIYVAGLLEATQVADTGQGFATYIQIIPYISYAWAAAFLVPLVAIGLVPPLGAMKKAEDRAKVTGILTPPDSEDMELVSDKDIVMLARPKLYNFLLPVVVLIAGTILLDKDALKGVILAVGFAAALYLGQKLMTFAQISQYGFEGFKMMIYPLAIVVMSFVLKNVNDELGLTTFIIETVKPLMHGGLLPLVAFLSLSVVAFATGSFWGVYAIAIPIIVPLAAAMEVDIHLAVGAVLSAGAFGSHACFYGDATVLSAAATGCNNVAHAVTQLPYTLLAAGAASIFYLVAGVYF